MIDFEFLGFPPRGLIERSRQCVEHFLFFGSSHYDEYVMVDGVSHYAGSVDYTKICLQ